MFKPFADAFEVPLFTKKQLAEFPEMFEKMRGRKMGFLFRLALHIIALIL